ncbi:hypothetical protein BaRGS_00017401 [Batillaria attramentaria]|uniref:Gfo/Idh/MocA-like oxidoreductase N-terminal domain-containing protein n=1 Tax=Batillaria attramentaria TaxID=370345 RepID=A0ABD0KVU8_9CAEN
MAACTRRVFGVVVVGVGIAGRVRIRDVQECTCGLQLKGFVSRRQLDIPGVQQLGFDEALNDPDVHAVIVCSEPVSHEDFVQQALDNGKHVLVEYPVTPSSEAASNLYRKAADKGLILHEENIALLTETHRKLKDMAASKKLKSGSSSLVGKPFYSSVGEIQVLYDVFGDLKVAAASMDVSSSGLNYCGEFTPKNEQGKLSIKVERYKEKVQRSTSKYVEFEDGQVFDSQKEMSNVPPGPRKPGLFMQDLEIFAAKLHGERTVTDYEVTMSIRSLELAEEANALLK